MLIPGLGSMDAFLVRKASRDKAYQMATERQLQGEEFRVPGKADCQVEFSAGPMIPCVFTDGRDWPRRGRL